MEEPTSRPCASLWGVRAAGGGAGHLATCSRQRAPWSSSTATSRSIRVSNARMVFFSDEELDSLVKTLPEMGERDVENEWLVPFVITARWIGARRNELLHLERR